MVAVDLQVRLVLLDEVANCVGGASRMENIIGNDMLQAADKRLQQPKIKNYNQCSMAFTPITAQTW